MSNYNKKAITTALNAAIYIRKNDLHPECIGINPIEKLFPDFTFLISAG